MLIEEKQKCYNTLCYTKEIKEPDKKVGEIAVKNGKQIVGWLI